MDSDGPPPLELDPDLSPTLDGDPAPPLEFVPDTTMRDLLIDTENRMAISSQLASAAFVCTTMITHTTRRLHVYEEENHSHGWVLEYSELLCIVALVVATALVAANSMVLLGIEMSLVLVVVRWLAKSRVDHNRLCITELRLLIHGCLAWLRMLKDEHNNVAITPDGDAVVDPPLNLELPDCAYASRVALLYKNLRHTLNYPPDRASTAPPADDIKPMNIVTVHRAPPPSAAYRTPVAQLDFSSLYPSLEHAAHKILTRRTSHNNGWPTLGPPRDAAGRPTKSMRAAAAPGHSSEWPCLEPPRDPLPDERAPLVMSDSSSDSD